MRITITLLSYDHGILRQVFDVVGDMAQTGNLGNHRDVLADLSDFLQTFMDRYHHGKEERCIFPLAENGPDRLKAMIPDLINDHRKAKSFADAIAQDIESWNEDALAQNCIDLVAHMREHIREEEDFVFPMLEEIMDADRDLAIFERTQAFVRDNFGEDYPKRMEDFANQLQNRVWGEGVVKYTATER